MRSGTNATGLSRPLRLLGYPLGAQVSTLENLCKAIYIARQHGDLVTEEELFTLLLQLYRSPESLIVWTKPELLQHAA
jgi:hypothetical protein